MLFPESYLLYFLVVGLGKLVEGSGLLDALVVEMRIGALLFA